MENISFLLNKYCHTALLFCIWELQSFMATKLKDIWCKNERVRQKHEKELNYKSPPLFVDLGELARFITIFRRFNLALWVMSCRDPIG